MTQSTTLRVIPAVGVATVRVIAVDEDGNEIGVEDIPIVVDSPRLLAAVERLTEAVEKLHLLLEIQGG